MSSVTTVPEHVDLSLADALTTMKKDGIGDLAIRSFKRFRHADGFSYARALAFQLVLTVIPGVMFFVALAARTGEGRLREVLRAMTESLAPGPASQVILRVFEQGTDAATPGNLAAIAAGAVAMLTSGVAAMAQLQRGSSRMYGIDDDRPTTRRYGLALVLTITAGVLFALAFVVIALGSGITASFGEGDPRSTWIWVRWPLGVAVLPAAFALLYRIAPHRDQPAATSLAVGSTVAVVAWFVVSALLSIYLNASQVFGETYGPLAGVIGLMFWALASGVVTLFGVALNAQIESDYDGDRPVKSDEPRHAQPQPLLGTPTGPSS